MYGLAIIIIIIIININPISQLLLFPFLVHKRTQASDVSPSTLVHPAELLP